MNINDLGKDDKLVVEKILVKDRKDLSKEEILILKARKDYIREDEFKRLVGEEIKKVEILKTPVKKGKRN